jgi:Ca2+-transporting ATPase
MFSFLHKKTATPTAIFIDGLSSIVSKDMIVEDLWQQRQTINSIGDVLSKAINDLADPLDAALVKYVNTHTLTMPQQQPMHRIRFDPQDGISGNIWHHGEYFLPAIKGMPERVLDYCEMPDSERESIMIQLNKMSATGNTIIAIATGLFQHSLKDLSELKKNEKLNFIGFISVKMTVSPEARRLLTSIQADIHLATGHHPATTFAVVNALGLVTAPSEIFDARRLDVMNTNEIQATASTSKIFARATPERKEHIFDALKGSDKSIIRVTSASDLQKLLAN